MEKFGKPSCSAYIQAIDFTRHMRNLDPYSFGHLKFKFNINATTTKKKLQVAAETLPRLLSVSSRSWLSVPEGTTGIEVETAEVNGSLTEPPLSVVANLDANASALHEIITSRGFRCVGGARVVPDMCECE